MKKILICDLDGTLIDSRKDIATGVNLMRKEYGLGELSVEVITDFVGNGAGKLVERSLKDTGINVDDALEIMKIKYEEHICDDTFLYEGVEEGLKLLYDSNIPLAIVTNKPESLTKVIVKELKIDTYFSFIIGGDSVFPLKPDPAAIEFIIKETGADKDNSWIIGDNYTDLAAGRNAGVQRCFAAYGFGHSKNEECDLKVESFKEFINFLFS